MRLATITVTCRKDPRYAEMARTLFASFCRARTDTLLDWIIVDERLWLEPPQKRQAEIAAALAALPGEVAGRIRVEMFPPPPSLYRGPDIADPLPAHNTARNAGLQALAPDTGYVVFLSDCSVVTQDWVSVALDLAAQGLGWKCQHKELYDHKVPAPFRFQDAWDSLHPVQAQTVAGPCWGVPKEVMTAVAGFDSDYDGEDDLYDHEILLRLSRAGCSFVTTKRAWVVRLNRTRQKTEVTTRQESLRANRNRAYYHSLQIDRDRILPGAAAAAASPVVGRRPVVHHPDRTVALDTTPPTMVTLKSFTVPAAPNPGVNPAQAAPPPAAVNWPSFQPHPDDPTRCYVCGETVGMHGTESNHCHPAIIQKPLGAQTSGLGSAAPVYGSGFAGPVHLTHPGQLASDPVYETIPPSLAGGGGGGGRVIAAFNRGVPVVQFKGPLDPARASIVLTGPPVTTPPKEKPPVTTPPPKMPSLHERALAAAAQKKDRAAKAAAGVVEPVESNERCAYIPTQGQFKGERCLLRSRHPGWHKFEEKPVPGDGTFIGPMHQPGAAPAPTAPQGPPEPPPAIATARDKLDQHIEQVETILASLPADPIAKHVVMLAVVLRREGVLADAATFHNLVDTAVSAETPNRAAVIEATMRAVPAVCQALPPIPVTAPEFRTLSSFAKMMDDWRRTSALMPRSDMSLYDRAYAAAGDMFLAIHPPDDLRSMDDALANLERSVAAGEGEDDVASVEALTEEEAAKQKAAIDAMEAELHLMDVTQAGVEEPAGQPDVPPPGTN